MDDVKQHSWAFIFGKEGKSINCLVAACTCKEEKPRTHLYMFREFFFYTDLAMPFHLLSGTHC